MLNVHDGIIEILCAFISEALPSAKPGVTARSAYAELAAPLEFSCKLPAAECAGRLAKSNAARPPVYLGAPLLDCIAPHGGYVCFSLSPDVYSAALRHIIQSCPPPPLPNEAKSDADYAICRMLMLSRRPSGPFPNDPAIRAAVWRTLGIPSAPPARKNAARQEAARLLLGMLDGKSASERAALSLGEVGAAAARLLAYD